MIQGASIAGAERIIAVDVHSRKLEFAASLVQPIGSTPPVRIRSLPIRDLTDGRGADFTFEARRKESIEQAYAATRKGGTCVVIGIGSRKESVNLREPVYREVPVKLTSGVRLGPYEILGPLGAGGMGEVYSARDTRLGRTVAIKVLPSDLADNARLKTRFEREAKAISALNHPHICALYDVGDSYLVMEHCEGITLATRISDGPLPIEQVRQYGIEIADALDQAHRHGIIHRDLKPLNIMLTKSGVKVLDFGLAKQQVAASSPEEATIQQVTEEGKILGTIQYMAPEVLHGEEADARSDIFALGLVLYEMVTGKPAFTGTSRASLIAAILEREPKPIAELQPASPPALDRLIHACLAKDPDQRIQSAHDVKLQLEWSSDAVVPAVRPTRRRAWSGIATAVLVTAVLASLGTWVLARSRPAPRPLRRFSILLPQDLTVSRAIAISRDGRHLVYQSGRSLGSGENGPLCLRNMETGDIKPLADTDDAVFPFFSPDGEWIGFQANGELKKIALAGGGSISVCKLEQLRGATWLPNDDIVFSSPLAPMQRVSSAGGIPQKITAAGSSFGYWPSVLPDGEHLLYTVGKGNGEWEHAHISVLSLRDGRSSVVLEGGTYARYARGHLIYSRSGSLFAVPFDAKKLRVMGSPVPIASEVGGNPANGLVFFDVADDGMLVYKPSSASALSELVWVDRKGTLAPVSKIRRQYGPPRISPDGGQIAVEMTEHRSTDLWLLDVQRETWMRLTSGGTNLGAVWSPDGKRILFGSNRNGPYTVYSTPSDGSQPPQQIMGVSTMLTWTFPAAISRDGRSLLLLQSIRGESTMSWIADLAQPDIVKPLMSTTSKNLSVDLSPDARWIVFSSDETGRSEIYLSRFPSVGRKWPLSAEGGSDPRFRHDGSEVFYRNGNKMMAADLTLGPEAAIGKPRILFEGDYEREFDVTADGKRFLMVRSAKPPPSQVNVVLGLFDNSKP